MASIVIHTDNKKDISLLRELAAKMGLSSHILSREEKEDLNFGELMIQNDAAENLVKEDAIAYYHTLKKK